MTKRSIGMALILLSLLSLTRSMAQTDKLSKNVSLLLEKDIPSRNFGYSGILQDRRNMIEELKSLVTQPLNEINSPDYTRYLAIKLLGEIRAEEAIDFLSDNLLFVPAEGDPFTKVRETQDYYPCAVALVKIGTPAIGHMTRKIAQSDSPEERNLATWVIMRIEGPEQATFRLQRMVDITTRRSKEHLQEAVSYIKNFKPTGEPPKPHKWVVAPVPSAGDTAPMIRAD